MQAMSKESTECQPEVLDSEDLLFMLYTSGSTGAPKGLSHSQAGYLLYASLTHQVLMYTVCKYVFNVGNLFRKKRGT